MASEQASVFAQSQLRLSCIGSQDAFGRHVVGNSSHGACESDVAKSAYDVRQMNILGKTL